MKNSNLEMTRLGKLLCADVYRSQDEPSTSVSSIETDEQARLVINGEKVFRLWERQGQQIFNSRGPRNSTPIRRHIRSNEYSLRKSHETGSLPNLASDQTVDVQTPLLFKSRSENDVSSMNSAAEAMTGYQNITEYQKGTRKDSRRTVTFTHQETLQVPETYPTYTRH